MVVDYIDYQTTVLCRGLFFLRSSKPNKITSEEFTELVHDFFPLQRITYGRKREIVRLALSGVNVLPDSDLVLNEPYFDDGPVVVSRLELEQNRKRRLETLDERAEQIEDAVLALDGYCRRATGLHLAVWCDRRDRLRATGDWGAMPDMLRDLLSIALSSVHMRWALLLHAIGFSGALSGAVIATRAMSARVLRYD